MRALTKDQIRKEFSATRRIPLVRKNKSFNAALYAQASGGGGPTPTPPPTEWPFGADGDLVIDGTVVILNGGTVIDLGFGFSFGSGPYPADWPPGLLYGVNKDYNSITIKNHGALVINDPAGYWAIIGCAGNISVDATSFIAYNSSYGGLGDNGGVAQSQDPNGFPLYWAPGFGFGGSGGQFDMPPSFSGNPYLLNGGGGANIDANGGDAVYNRGGDGSSGGGGPGGAGGTFPAGQTGGDGFPDMSDGSGGGGGSGGRSGGPLYIRCRGNVNIQGTVVLYGNNGGGGGAGGDSQIYTGGGGGGGAGGSGGFFLLRYHGTYGGTVIITGGLGGGGGNGGDNSGFGGEGGAQGDDGFAGMVDIAHY